MIKFIKKWYTEIFLIFGATGYLFSLISNKDWYNLMMVICLYIIIGLLVSVAYHQSAISEIRKEQIELLEQIIREN